MKYLESEISSEAVNKTTPTGIDSKKLLVTVFSSLQGLEKCVESSKKMMAKNLDNSADLIVSLKEQTKIVNQMRRTANKIQIQIAQENWSETMRSLQIFYGLRKIVRPEIMTTFQALANKTSSVPCVKKAASIH